LHVGTVLTEWDGGRQICAEFLKSEADWRTLADQLVAIALHYGFDGWLLNIENGLQVRVWFPEERGYYEVIHIKLLENPHMFL